MLLTVAPAAAVSHSANVSGVKHGPLKLRTHVSGMLGVGCGVGYGVGYGVGADAAVSQRHFTADEHSTLLPGLSLYNTDCCMLPSPNEQPCGTSPALSV